MKNIKNTLRTILNTDKYFTYNFLKRDRCLYIHIYETREYDSECKSLTLYGESIDSILRDEKLKSLGI